MEEREGERVHTRSGKSESEETGRDEYQLKKKPTVTVMPPESSTTHLQPSTSLPGISLNMFQVCVLPSAQ